MTNTTYTDCRSEVGITVGVIDAIITLCRLLHERDMSGDEVAQALQDLRHDENFANLLRRMVGDEVIAP